MRRLINPMAVKIREINVKIGQMITEDGQVFTVKDLKIENMSCNDSGTEKEFSVKSGSYIKEADPPWMICDGEGFGR